ncbi:helix-turn-helix domain-containing protein [Mycobacterium sp. 050272]|uniref:winged helix-turn-helix transcriptional regulator n=1 Tax=Mycobacteriaceae TaxID=1762 RepID=UPI003185C4D6
MPRQSFANVACSIARSLDVVGGRWTPLILRDLFVGMSRFEDIRRDLGIASNVLAERLAMLERHTIVERRQYQSSPVRHEYRLTAKGLELYPVIATLIAWGDKWLSTAAPVLTVHYDCGKVTAAKIVCAECGGNLTAANTAAVAGPGAHPGPGTAIIGEYLTTDDVITNSGNGHPRTANSPYTRTGERPTTPGRRPPA